MNISCLIKNYFSFKGKIDFHTCATRMLKIILSLISVIIIIWLPYFLPGFYMKYITDSSVEDIERYLDSSYAMNYLDIMSFIMLILILLAIVSTLSLIVRFIRWIYNLSATAPRQPN